MSNLLCRWFGIFCPPEPTPPPGEISPDPPPQGGFAAECMNETNAERDKHGLPPVVYQACLASKAQEHAEDMHGRRTIGHWGFSERLRSCNYGTGSENVASGYATAKGVVRGWMNSPGHRANILGNYNLCGIGYINGYWCQMFARDKHGMGYSDEQQTDA